MEKTPLSQLINLGNKIAIVTGAGGGIGQGIARRLHEAGASIVVVDIDPQTAEATATELNRTRDNSAMAIQADVSQSADAERVVSQTISSFGGLDIMVNNAGIFPIKTLAEMTDDDFDKVVATNLRSVYLFTKKSSDQMKRQGRAGCIINVASIDSLHPSMVGLAAYDASKHGVWGLTKNTALELAEFNIRVNAIAPGGVLTPGVKAMSGGDATGQEQSIPMKRLADPDEIGRVAVFLASDLASYVTGSMIVADGGMLLK